MTATTRYEIAAKHPDGRAFLVAYASGSPSRSRLLRIIHERGEQILAALGLEIGAGFSLHMRPRIHAELPGGWTIAFTGRTQREVRGAGRDLPFIGGEK